MQNSIKISVSMIVKNEEAMLARCLESVKGADEIVIVDTGSIDKTKEIAEKFTENIYNFEWCDDFASARNFAIDNTLSEWILSIDADEILEEGGIEKIKEFLSTFEGDVVKVHMHAGNNDFYVPRLFKNNGSTKFEGKIHETLNVLTDTRLDVKIEYGFSPAHALDPDRNIRILEKEVEADSKNTRALYYLGREYGYRKDYEKAIPTLTKYTALATFLPEKADAFFILALCYWYTQKGEQARRSVLLALSLNANFKAAIQLMGHMSFQKNRDQWNRMAETATNEDTLFARINFLTI